MEHAATIARPYAKAIFELASEEGVLEEWAQLLQRLALIASDPQVVSFLMNPKSTQEQQQTLFIELGLKGASEKISKQGRRVIEELTSWKRLMVLPAIAALYADYLAEQKKVIETEVITTEPLSDKQQENLAKVLTRKLQRDVKLTYTQDPSIIGGIIIRAGDLVIDGSVRNRLSTMMNDLVSV